MGMVAGFVNKPDQPAEDIVREIVTEAEYLLSNASQYVVTTSKL